MAQEFIAENVASSPTVISSHLINTKIEKGSVCSALNILSAGSFSNITIIRYKDNGFLVSKDTQSDCTEAMVATKLVGKPTYNNFDYTADKDSSYELPTFNKYTFGAKVTKIIGDSVKEQLEDSSLFEKHLHHPYLHSPPKKRCMFATSNALINTSSPWLSANGSNGMLVYNYDQFSRALQFSVAGKEYLIDYLNANSQHLSDNDLPVIASVFQYIPCEYGKDCLFSRIKSSDNNPCNIVGPILLPPAVYDIPDGAQAGATSVKNWIAFLKDCSAHIGADSCNNFLHSDKINCHREAIVFPMRTINACMLCLLFQRNLALERSSHTMPVISADMLEKVAFENCTTFPQLEHIDLDPVTMQTLALENDFLVSQIFSACKLHTIFSVDSIVSNLLFDKEHQLIRADKLKRTTL